MSGDERNRRKGAAQRRAKVFIVHGRDLRARDALSAYLTTLGLDVVAFERAAADVAALPVISEVVREGLGTADVIVVLFTPDEMASLYNDSTGLFDASDPTAVRWQSRPNVLFEAGWAFGARRARTVFATLGEDAALFSDAAGLHVVRLELPDAKERLRDRIRRILRGRAPLEEIEQSSSEGFGALVRRRLRFHDELATLRLTLANTTITVRKRSPARKRAKLTRVKFSLLILVHEVVALHRRDPNWSWELQRPVSLIGEIAKRHGDAAADDAFWWLVTTGFFQFTDIQHWGDHYKESIHISVFTRRATKLLEWLRHRPLKSSR